jgi:hypothetical protein
MRSLAALLVVFLLIAPSSIATATCRDLYPSQTAWNEASIINHETWDIFRSIGGFSNVPNVNASCEENKEIHIEWSDSRGHTHLAKLNSSWHSDVGITVRIHYEERNDLNVEIINTTLSTVSFGEYDDSDLYLTAFRDAMNVTHIFWEKSFTPYDVTWRFWLYHESIDKNGGILASGELFYYEKFGSDWWDVPLYQIVIWLSIIVVIALITTVILLHRRRKRKEVSRIDTPDSDHSVEDT